MDPACDPVSDTVPTATRGALHQRHRRVRSRNWLVSSLKTVSFLIAALTAVIVAMVSVFGGIVAYDPLRAVATSHAPPSSVLRWWPLLVYGPWLVASLCILRAALLQRRAVHSWAVVLFFSAVAVVLCVSHAPKSVIDASAAALPTIAALSCFQQLVRLITLTRPPRQSVPRHRQSSGPAGVGRLLGDSDHTRKTSPVAEQPAAQPFLGGAQSRIPQQHSTAPGASGRRRL
ncbi:DUF2637 domain-containing protein [Streptomyces sp. GC420]|nr:DUF2637 domain-containing protein [Streptomyces sp. GC420]